MKRLIFPVINALVFVMLFAVIGYYVFDPVRWIVVGMVLGLGIGLLIEFGLGATILVMAAPDEPRLKAIWSDGLGINNLEDVPPQEGVGAAFTEFINRQAFWIAELYLGEQIIANKRLIPQIAPRHLTLIAAGIDPYEAEFNRGYEPLLGENGMLWVIEDAPHVGGIVVHGEEYTARMIAFFDEALRQ